MEKIIAHKVRIDWVPSGDGDFHRDFKVMFTDDDISFILDEAIAVKCRLDRSIGEPTLPSGNQL